MKKLFLDLDAKHSDYYTYQGLESVNKELLIFGTEITTIKELSFISEFFNLNKENLINKTLTKENVIIPQLKMVEVEYVIVESSTTRKKFKGDFETYSKSKNILTKFFEGDYNQADDSIDTYYDDPDDTDYLETERTDSYVGSVKDKQ